MFERQQDSQQIFRYERTMEHLKLHFNNYQNIRGHPFLRRESSGRDTDPKLGQLGQTPSYSFSLRYKTKSRTFSNNVHRKALKEIGDSQGHQGGLVWTLSLIEGRWARPPK